MWRLAARLPFTSLAGFFFRAVARFFATRRFAGFRRATFFFVERFFLRTGLLAFAAISRAAKIIIFPLFVDVSWSKPLHQIVI